MGRKPEPVKYGCVWAVPASTFMYLDSLLTLRPMYLYMYKDRAVWLLGSSDGGKWLSTGWPLVEAAVAAHNNPDRRCAVINDTSMEKLMKAEPITAGKIRNANAKELKLGP